MNRTAICIIGVYFGKLPEYINLWLKSCSYNPDIDFIIFGDNKIDNLPPNVKHIPMTLQEMKKFADEKLGLDTALYTPYKCCDFKVAYGNIFEDYLSGYDFWGHCDFDLIFGDIRGFITEKILSEYDKILSLGHLSLYRNTKEVNNRYKLPGSTNNYKAVSYKTVFENEKSFAFDEWCGIYRIYNFNNLKMYKKLIFADISCRFKRFRLSFGKGNHNNQVFYWQNGKVFGTHYKHKRYFTEEYIYIHFQKRGFNETVSQDCDAFYIGPGGFTVKSHYNTPTLHEIQKINPYNAKTEINERIKYYTGDYLRYIYYRLRDKYLR